MKASSIFTQAVHAGERTPPSDYTPVSTPIYHSVGYLYDEMDDLDQAFAGTKPGYVYARFGNPTTTAWERAVATVEGAEDAVAFGSGMAALHAAFLAAGARTGATFLAARDLYGATYHLLARFFTTQGLTTHFLDLSDLDAVERALVEYRPAALVCEIISNPLLKIADLPALVERAHRYGTAVIVDSTFGTPYLLRPLEYGADYVVHSATKYLAGHGDVLGGIVLGATARMKACTLTPGVRDLLKILGANLGPEEAYLALRGLKTFPLRMRQHCANAAEVAAWLEAQPSVRRVYYPGLPSHPQHALAQRLFGARGYGGMVAFELEGGNQERIFSFFNALQLCLPATTLGDVYSLVMYPAHAPHRSMTPEERQQAGVGPGLVRVSVGIEEVTDIIADLEQALRVVA